MATRPKRDLTIRQLAARSGYSARQITNMIAEQGLRHSKRRIKGSRARKPERLFSWTEFLDHCAQRGVIPPALKAEAAAELNTPPDETRQPGPVKIRLKGMGTTVGKKSGDLYLHVRIIG